MFIIDKFQALQPPAFRPPITAPTVIVSSLSPGGETIQRNPAFDYQSESSGDTETETDDTSAPPEIEDTPDNNY